MRTFWSRFAIFLMLATLALGIFPSSQGVDAAGPSSSSKAERPQLAVLLVFDQLRGDFISRWYDLYPEGGFRRLTTEGAWFVDCHYPYASCMTGPGHATISTGTTPKTHGIVANDWYDLKRSKTANCVGSDRHVQVPANPEKSVKTKYSASPEPLLAPTVADAMKAQLGKEVRVVSLSLKDRSAVLPGGKAPDVCYWSSTSTGAFVTSTYYRDSVHPWVAEYNKSGAADRWLGKRWERLRTDFDYDLRSGPDDHAGEGTGAKQGRTFPHLFGDKKSSRKTYLDAVATSPFGNELLWEFAERAIDAEKLGSRSTPDLLCVSFSSNDLVGHAWGPDSHEVLDMTLRTDLLIKRILTTLDQKVGKGKYTIVLSADHGICPLPEVSRERHIDAGRVSFTPLLAAAEEHLDKAYPGSKDEVPDKTSWVASFKGGMIYFDRKKLVQRGVKPEAAATTLSTWLPQQRGVAAGYTKDQLGSKSLDPIGVKVRESYYPERSGDVMVVLKPYWLPGDTLTGTTHGTPYRYDTHVPLIAFGPGIKPGTRKDLVSPEAAAVIMAESLGIQPPQKAAVKVPSGLFTR